MALAAQQIEVSVRDDRVRCVQKDIVLVPELGLAAEVQKVTEAVDLGGGLIAVCEFEEVEVKDLGIRRNAIADKTPITKQSNPRSQPAAITLEPAQITKAKDTRVSPGPTIPTQNPQVTWTSVASEQTVRFSPEHTATVGSCPEPTNPTPVPATTQTTVTPVAEQTELTSTGNRHTSPVSRAARLYEKSANSYASKKVISAIDKYNKICGKGPCFATLLILAVLPVVTIVIGFVYLNDCPGESKIPIWLVVFGFVCLLQTLIRCIKRCCCCTGRDNTEDSKISYWIGNSLEVLLIMTLGAWTLAGSAWVFGNFYVLGDPRCTVRRAVDLCCHLVPYYCAFSLIIGLFGFVIIVCISLCCYCSVKFGK